MSTMLDLGEKAEKDADKLWHEVYDKKEVGNTPKDNGTPKTEDTPKPEDKPKDEPKPEDKPKEKSPEGEDYKHKFEVVKGKLDAEIPRYAMDLAEANKKLAEANERVANLEKKIGEIPKPEPKKDEPKPLSPPLQKLKDEYPDIFEGQKELTQTMIQEALDKWGEKVGKTVDKVTEKVEKVDEKVTKGDRQRFEETIRLDPEVGKEIDTINSDPRFKDWLSEVDDYTGLTRGELATDSITRMDKETTLKFFKNFKKEKMAPPPKTEDKPKDKPKEDKPAKDADISPPRGGGSQIVTDEEITTVTPDSLRNHYKEYSQGKWKGRDQEWEAEEKRIHSALTKHLYGKK